MTIVDVKAGEHLEVIVARVRRLALLASLAFVAVAAGYWYVQLARGSYYRSLADNNRLRRSPVEAPRGVISDRNGVLLVENVPSYNLLLDRSRAQDESESLEFAAVALGRSRVSLEEVQGRYANVPKFRPILMAEDLSLNQVARFEVAALEHPEFRIEVRQRRLYRYGPQIAHLLGYLGEVDERELATRDLPAGELVGREGVEQAYDDTLRGVAGEREVIVDSRGRIVEEYRRKGAVDGEPLRLTLDLELQKEAAHLMADEVGSIVAIDPRDGAVRALVSSPSYDPNSFVRRLDQDEWRQILVSPAQPLQNRAIQNTYAPGSLFKIVMGVAALSEGVTDRSRTVFCNGSIRLHDRRRRCHLAGGHGWVNLHEALRVSCDVYFYVMGNDLGIEPIGDYARRFGLGSRTGLPLPGERAGLVPGLRWSLEARNTPWYPGETVSVAIGQGPILTTPLQVAVSVAVAANGGNLVRPFLVEGQGEPPVPLGLDPDALEQVRSGLKAVVNERGTGASARLPGVEIAGKTGTAQVIEQLNWTKNDDLPYQHRDHAWFGAFAPYESPELVIVVFVEHGGHGSRAAAPKAKALYEKYFELD